MRSNTRYLIDMGIPEPAGGGSEVGWVVFDTMNNLGLDNRVVMVHGWGWGLMCPGRNGRYGGRLRAKYMKTGRWP